MKRVIFLVAFYISAINSLAQIPQWQWATIGNNIDMGYGTSTEIDLMGNIYVSGSYLNTITLDTFCFTSKGGFDVIVSKYNPSYQLLWAKSIGGIGDDAGTFTGGSVITVDAANNIYLSFPFADSIVVDSHTYYSKGGKDIAIIKFDSIGNLIWGKSYGSIYDDRPSKIILKNNRLYLCGEFSKGGTDSIKFDSLKLISKGNSDIFFFKSDTTGSIIWAKGVGNSLGDVPAGIAVDKSDNIYITGNTGGNLKLENDTLWNVNANGMNFIVKYDSTGYELWAKSAYSSGVHYSTDVCVDTNNNVYTTGFTTDDNTIKFGSIWLISQWVNKTYLAKYAPNGQLVFAKLISTYTYYDKAHSLKINPLDNTIYLCGGYNYLANYGSDTLHSYGHDDVLVLKLDENGNVLWATHAGGGSQDGAYALAVAPNGDIAVTGYTQSNPCKFGNQQVSSVGDYDIFIAKLSQTTGIANSPEKESLDIYPNPADEVIFIRSKEAIASIKVYDPMGRLVKERDNLLQTKEVSIVTKDLAEGIYYVQVTMVNGYQVTEKMIVGR